MSLTKPMQDGLNKQINAEFGAFYQYLAMQSYFVVQNLDGFAHWMGAQAHEELGHATKLVGYVHDRRGQVVLDAIKAPKVTWKSPLAALEDAFAHEQRVTGMIATLVELARKNKDHATEIFLQWYVTEQVEEEASFDKVVQRMHLAGDTPTGLLILDREMGARGSQG